MEKEEPDLAEVSGGGAGGGGEGPAWPRPLEGAEIPAELRVLRNREFLGLGQFM